VVINGQLAFQKCHPEHGCVNEDVKFAAQLGKGVPIGPLDFTKPATPAPAVAAAAAPTAATGAAYDLGAIQFTELEAAEKSVVYYLFWAFIGGMVLNLMPCVLPVIGLKVMSFVQQAGYSRSKALALNLWYSLGIMVVFWALAVLAAFAGLSWGEQFGSTTFNIVMASLVFVMALSLLGVWEIHVPDAVNRSASHSVVQQEGATGAFFKGVMTTLLATPCTGPGMALALGWAVRQSSLTILAVFTMLGLGMATPYLLIGAFPSLVNFLPRPGNWMVTFKQLMGFVLLGTVIFLLAQLEAHYLLPALCLLVALGLGCWVYSLLPIGAPFGERSQTYALCGAIVAAGAVFGFGWLAPVLQGGEEDWQDFSLAKLQQVAVEDGKTVLVDFGADWCTNCIVLENTVLHTKPVEESIKKNGVVPMFADFSKQPPELKKTLSALNSNGVPVIAIFPGGAPHQPIVFRGVYTQSQLLDAIHTASSIRRQSPIAIHSGAGSAR
ncbi:MAG: thioredoxin family protein, partial [Planctomycetales bacterium]|nr:thioredoxin family protein [Planctomycetales bacterium]